MMAKASMDSMIGQADQAPDESVALAVVGEQMPDTQWQTGEIEFRPDEIFFSRLRMLQGQSPEVSEGKEGAKPGFWALSGFDTFLPEVMVIPMSFARGRVYAVGEGQDRQTMCRSNDAVFGYGKPLPTLPSGKYACAVCPQAQWGPPDPKTGKGTPPACDELKKYIVYAVPFGTACELQFKRTGMTAAGTINKALQGLGAGRFGAKLTSTRKSGAKGTYFIPDVKIDLNVSPETLTMVQREMDIVSGAKISEAPMDVSEFGEGDGDVIDG